MPRIERSPAEFPRAEHGSHASLPDAPGTYALIYRVRVSARPSVGALGTVELASGCLVYVGSAFGPGGVAGRLRHHLRPLRRPHWHVDYLRPFVSLQGVWYAAGERALEHAWARALPALLGGTPARRGFGASDCACEAHLVHGPAAAACRLTGARLAAAAGGPAPRFLAAPEARALAGV